MKVKTVVILAHGIRDFALWQSTIRSTLENAGLLVEPVNYGRLNLLKFLVPIGFFRRQAIDAVWNQIRIIKERYPAAPLCVVAHSFGTYVISHILKENFDVKFHRILFCGSILDYSFKYEDFKERFADPIVNDVGTRDIWPALAESITFGYGSSGTYGFRRPLVRDRWHNGARHSFFLNQGFCRKYWVPFLLHGEILAGDDEPESPKLWLQLLTIFKIKHVLLVALLILVSVYLVGQFSSMQARAEIQKTAGEFESLRSKGESLTVEYNNQRPNYNLLRDKKQESINVANGLLRLNVEHLTPLQVIGLHQSAAHATVIAALIEDTAKSPDKSEIQKLAAQAANEAELAIKLIDGQRVKGVTQSYEAYSWLANGEIADRVKFIVATSYALDHKHGGKRTEMDVYEALAVINRDFRMRANINAEGIFASLCNMTQQWRDACQIE